jgi:hypothetical protein
MIASCPAAGYGVTALASDGTAEAAAECRLAAARDEVWVSMPAPYAAFCAGRRDAYCRYAAVRVGCAWIGAHVALAALGDLAMAWAEALQSASPAAVSWSLLAARTSAHSEGGLRGLHGVLPALQADVLVLRYKVGLSAREAACLLGVDVMQLAVIQQTALRAMAGEEAGLFWHMRGV